MRRLGAGIDGHVRPGFEALRDAFAENFSRRHELGGACCVYYRGEKVVDLWGGVRNKSTGQPWQEDTMVIVYSSTKGVTAVCVHRLIERVELELEAPIARYWPEFAARGKQDLPLRWALCHKLGLAAVEGTFTMADVLERERSKTS